MVTECQPVSFDPSRPDFAPYGLTCVRWSPSRMERPDHHNEVELNFLESGSVTYLLGGEKTVVEPRRLGVFWGAIPHQIIDFARGTEYFVATVPLQCFLEWRLPQDFVQPLMQGRLASEPGTARADADARSFARWEADLRSNALQLERPVLLEMQARLVRLALEVPTLPRTPNGRAPLTAVTEGGLSKVEQMACFVARHYTEKLTVKQVSETVKLHPNYAMSLFQKTFGMTLVTYLTRHRVSHAQRLLVATDRTTAEIALQSGFNSLSRFSEAFRRACGCSPTQYRKSHALPDHPRSSGTGPRP